MKYSILLIITLFLFSCGNEKVLQLPEISHSEITDLKDVSHAYLFYDETKEDSVELNRKNLISTTNWLINVDKRLTLKQAIPHIKYLQDKKANSSHKNENAKNYFTCNDTSIKNLGFIEFTDVNYFLETKQKKSTDTRKTNTNFWIEYYSNDSITLYTSAIKCIVIHKVTNSENMLKDLNKTFILTSDKKINIKFNPKLCFQDYVLFKSTLRNNKIDSLEISTNEFIY